MLRWLFFGFVSLGAIPTGVSRTPPSKSLEAQVDPPRLRVEPGGKLDLGDRGPREITFQRYLFTNISAAPITLRLLDLSPGVTVDGPGLRHAIPAGAVAELTLRLDPTGWVGPQSRNVRLGSDDPGQGQYYLPLVLRVRPDLTVDGERRDLGDVAVPESPQALFHFTRETGEPVALRVTQPLPPYLELELQERRNLATLAVVLRTTLVPPGVRLGFERIPVASSAPLQPQFDLYVSWKLHHPIEADPSRVVFLDRVQETLAVTLRAQSGLPFRIRSARVEGAGFEIGSYADAPVPTQRLWVRRTAERQAKAMLVIGFQDEDGLLKVPLAFLP